jgi:hypothetical protein
MTRAARATRVTSADPTMKGDANQSSSRPLSIVVWNALTKTTRSRSPTRSIRVRSIGVSRWRISRQATLPITAPNGRLM